MAAQREDYLVRLIAMLRRFVADIARARENGKRDEALQMILQAQERLFAKPWAEFGSLPAEDQLDLLSKGEPPAFAREKCILHANLLREAGLTYRESGAESLAPVALFLALRVLLATVKRFPESHSPELRAAIATVTSDLGIENMSDECRAEVADCLGRE